jgi:hypothetical protein
MLRVLFLSDDDFMETPNSFSTMKPSVKSLEIDSDDVFYVDDTGMFLCMKSRHDRIGIYSDSDLINHLKTRQ